MKPQLLDKVCKCKGGLCWKLSVQTFLKWTPPSFGCEVINHQSYYSAKCIILFSYLPCFHQSSWTRGFPGCRVWGGQASPHIPAGWVSVKEQKTPTSVIQMCYNSTRFIEQLCKWRAHWKKSITISLPAVQLQCVYHGVRADRKWEDSHYDGIPAAGGALRDAAGGPAGYHPKGCFRALPVRN